MNQRVSILPFLVLLLALAACKPQANDRDPVAYNDAIVDIQSAVVEKFDRFVDLADAYDSLGALQALEEAIAVAREGLHKLDSIPPFEKETQLRDAAKNLVAHYAQGLDQEFRKLLPVMVSHFSTLAELEKADSIRMAFSEEENHLFELLVKAQKEFSTLHKFEVAIP